jgi:hypothetical protein
MSEQRERETLIGVNFAEVDSSGEERVVVAVRRRARA